MKQGLQFKSLSDRMNGAIAVILCIALIACSAPVSVALTSQDQVPADSKLSNDQLDSLVAPIALYPDPIMSQVLMASTYPLEIVQLYQWMQKNKKMPPDKMAEAVKKENWDASVQAMVVLPDLVKNLNDNIKWTTDLGNAFLAQQSDVMDAVQRMRKKAKDKGALNSTEQQKVETKVVESKEVIVIQPATTEVVYVPSYNPTVVYGPPPVPYPVYAYPPPPPPGAYLATAAISFGVGMAVGAAWGHSYCCNAGWGGGNNNVYINNNNNYVKNTNIQGGNKTNVSGGNRNTVNGGGNNSWQHNPQHRGGTPYPNQASAQKYGGTTNANRQGGGRQNQAQAGGRQQASGNNRSNTQGGNRGASANNMGAQGGNRGASASTANRSGGGNQIGNQKVSSGSRGGSDAFGSGGNSRSSANASSTRGSSSMSGSRGGGGSRSGGSRSGGGGRRGR